MKVGEGSEFPTNVTMASRAALGRFDGGAEVPSMEIE